VPSKKFFSHHAVVILTGVGLLFSSTVPITALASEQTVRKETDIQWETWSDSVFERAKKEKKFVILDLEAVWCHWCHVMNEKTYSDPSVIKAIKSQYIAVRVDQDSRPDLSNRYQDYGWPATIFFAPDGTEVVKRAGFVPPATMATLLNKVVADPTPEKTDAVETDAVTTFAKSPFLSDDLKQSLEETYNESYDTEYGSWGIGGHKFLDWDSVEYTLTKSQKGDATAAARVKQTLDAQRNLLDPVWGGIYQYSTGGTWNNKHFEKIMSVQAENLRIYSLGYAQFQRQEDLDTAQAIRRFLNTFLRHPDGAYYTSMDADYIPGQHSEEYFQLDDAGRRKLGIPRIDKHVYARENGWVITALTHLYMATGDKEVLKEAEQAADWILANRSLPGGGFSHDAKDVAGPYLGDTLAMGRAFYALYQATGKRQWLVHAEQAAQFISTHFNNLDQKPGYLSAVPTGSVAKPRPLRDENVMMARFANNLFHVTGNKTYREMSENAMRFIATPEIANIPFAASTLLPNAELSADPTHITVVGHKDDPAAQALYEAALRYPAPYKRLDWWDTREGAMPNPDVQYPELDKAAAFICTEKRCSLPVFKPEALGPLVDRLTAKQAAPKPANQANN
jgi:uncharacterized protein YyaL (SSP411 family)